MNNLQKSWNAIMCLLSEGTRDPLQIMFLRSGSKIISSNGGGFTAQGIFQKEGVEFRVTVEIHNRQFRGSISPLNNPTERVNVPDSGLYLGVTGEQDLFRALMELYEKFYEKKTWKLQQEAKDLYSSKDPGVTS